MPPPRRPITLTMPTDAQHHGRADADHHAAPPRARAIARGGRVVGPLGSSMLVAMAAIEPLLTAFSVAVSEVCAWAATGRGQGWAVGPGSSASGRGRVAHRLGRRIAACAAS